MDYRFKKIYIAYKPVIFAHMPVFPHIYRVAQEFERQKKKSALGVKEQRFGFSVDLH